MTASSATTGEMDPLDLLGARAFADFLVRKDLVRRYSRQYPVPTDVVEALSLSATPGRSSARVDQSRPPQFKNGARTNGRRT